VRSEPVSKTADYIGQGIYSIPDVSRLTSIDSRKIARWVRGYEYHNRTGSGAVEPVFGSDYDSVNGKVALSFLDMVEIRFVDAFRRHGVSWRAIRIASMKAAELLKCGHPFSMRKFLTDGRTIIARIAHEQNDIELIDLVTDQFEFDKIITPYLYEGLDFSKHDTATRWWPLGKKHSIVIDPQRNFGKPIIDRYNVPTFTIAASFKGNKSYSEIAKWFEIDPRSVKEAIEFERKLVA
jgi:uncharacterized protein (DUF433 family)